MARIHYRRTGPHVDRHAKCLEHFLLRGALLYGGFSYTQDTQKAKIGPIELTVKENKTVNIPVWAGVAGLVIGGALLLFGTKGK